MRIGSVLGNSFLYWESLGAFPAPVVVSEEPCSADCSWQIPCDWRNCRHCSTIWVPHDLTELLHPPGQKCPPHSGLLIMCTWTSSYCLRQTHLEPIRALGNNRGGTWELGPQGRIPQRRGSGLDSHAYHLILKLTTWWVSKPQHAPPPGP